MKSPRLTARGVTLLELLIVMMILSLILTAAVKTWDVTLERGRFQTTQKKLSQLVSVIAGNEDYVVAGNRVDFGYIGDMGKLPQVLSELVVDPNPGLSPDSNPWRGPYLRSTFSESPDGYRIDGWGDSIVYNRESLFVRSYAGYGHTNPDKWITRYIDHTKSDLMENEVSGQVLDARGLPPPDSLTPVVDYDVVFTGPREGRIQRLPIHWETNGQFVSPGLGVPQGNKYQLRAVYRFVGPPLDSVVTYKTVTVYPGLGARSILLRLNTDWTAH
jgi:prepilin-type N-terminal cleavage/methylation domain-containing protein